MVSSRTLRAAACFGTAAMLIYLPGGAFAEQSVEEVIVTGSYIRRDNFETASPIHVMDARTIEQQGTPVLGEILRNSTFNYGVESVTNILAANPQGGASASANFRGLGENATLTLLDGKRTIRGGAGTSLTNLYPQILISRVEALTDGGSAVYGTEAVGGVLNIIPRKNYEGMEVRAGYNATTEDDWNEVAYSFIGGSRSDDGGFVVSMEAKSKDQLKFFDRPQYSLGAASYSSTAWPGNFSVPNRLPAQAGAVTSITQRRDPGCGQNNEPGATKADGVLAKRQGTAIAATTCLWEFGENFNYQPDSESLSAVALFDRQMTDTVSFEGELMFARQEVRDRGSPSNPGGRNSELPWIPGEHPGNPYRAFIDANNNGIYEPGGGDLLLFAQDANGDGIPDRGAPNALNPLGAVILGGGGGTDPDQGIPFNEDVKIVAWRPVGYPFQGPTRNSADSTGPGDGNFTSDNYRATGQVNFDIPDSSWTSFLRYTYARNEVEGPGGRVESLSAMSSGLTGNLLVRNEATGSSRLAWFNPFTTQNYACVNRDCSGGAVQTDSSQINTPEIYDSVARFEPTKFKQTLHAADLIATGDIFELPAGSVAIAVGGGYIRSTYAVDSGVTSNALDAYIGIGAPDFSEQRESYSAFAEVQVPVFESERFGRLEFTGAVRSEIVDDNAVEDLDHTDYKAAMRWEIRDWIAVRGSVGTAFISPSLADLFDPVTLGLSNVTDRFLGTGAFIARTLGGSATLQPEEADIYNVGFNMRFFDGDLTTTFDWHYIDFSDRIIRPIPQEILDLDRDNAVAAGYCTLQANGNCLPGDLPAWEASGLADPRIARNPTTGVIEVVDTDLLNAQSMKWKGFDTSVTYRFDSDQIPFVDAQFGRFGIGIEATYLDTYDYNSRESGPTIKGAGKRNNAVAAVPASPRWRSNLRLDWDFDRHTVVIYGRYIDKISGAAAGDPFCPVTTTSIAMGVTNGCPNTIGRYITWDAQYNIALDGLIWGERATSVSVGLLNAFDTDAKALASLGGLETAVYDPRGRIWYARITQQL
jgi:iron complex outermembrane receptor protein